MGGIPDVPPVRGGPLDEFWVAAEEGKLRLPRCPICREWSWYPPPTCGTDGVPPVWEEVPLTGTIFSFTVVHRSFLPPGTVEVPYTVALVELDGVPGPRLVGDVRTPEPVRIGDRVVVAFERLATHGLPVFDVVPAD
ncbi:MAG TPA: OB-fold domain-containing protein [Nocardioides sp.]